MRRRAPEGCLRPWAAAASSPPVKKNDDMSRTKAQAELEDLLESVGFEDGAEWGPQIGKDKPWPMGWVKAIDNKPREKDGGLAALTELSAFIQDLIRNGTTGAKAQAIIGSGDRTLKNMEDILKVRNRLAASDHADSITDIITVNTTAYKATQAAKLLLHPAPIAEEPSAKRQRRQAARDPGCVDSGDNGLSCEFASPPSCQPRCALPLARY